MADEKRQFVGEVCKDRCPFLQGANYEYTECDLYAEDLVKINHWEENDNHKRCKKCIDNIKPGANNQQIKLLKSIDAKMDEILSSIGRMKY